MATKTLPIFLLALVLLVSTKVSSTEEGVVTEHRRPHENAPEYAPAKPPVHSPTKAPIYAPKKGPIYPPKEAPIHPPVKAPVYPPKKAPAYPPTASPPTKSVTHPHGNCISMCATYCKLHRPKRECQRHCVPCCDQYKCVPGPHKSCSKWGETIYHGQKIKCP